MVDFHIVLGVDGPEGVVDHDVGLVDAEPPALFLGQDGGLDVGVVLDEGLQVVPAEVGLDAVVLEDAQ